MIARIPRRFEPVSDFELECYLCGELDAAASSILERHIAADAALRTYVEQRQQARASFVALHPLRLKPRRPARELALMLPLLAAAAALITVFTWRPLAAPPPPTAADAVRVKGQPGLSVQLTVKRGDQLWQHREELPLRPGDRLMLALNTDGPGYVTLLGRDTAGHITTYYDALPTAGGRFVAPDSLTLDTQTGDELWLVVFSQQPTAAEVYAQNFARREPIEAQTASIRIQKETP